MGERDPAALGRETERRYRDARIWSVAFGADARSALVGGGLPMPSSLLITGATGMIGSLLADALVGRGVEFTVTLRPGG